MQRHGSTASQYLTSLVVQTCDRIGMSDDLNRLARSKNDEEILTKRVMVRELNLVQPSRTCVISSHVELESAIFTAAISTIEVHTIFFLIYTSTVTVLFSTILPEMIY